MWFGVAEADGEVTLKADGEYAYKVVRLDDSEYIFYFTYAPGSVNGATNLVQAALDKVNTAEITDRVAAYNLVMEVAETLGLNVGEGSDFAGLVIGRAEAAAKDLLDNRGDGYDLATIRAAFDEIVATRLVFEESVALFAGATTEQPLANLDYITMLVTNLEAVEYQTIHSGRSINDDILPELNKLVEDFEALTPEQQETVLKDMNYSATTSSTATRNALRAAITQVLADEEAAIGAALDKVNTAEITDRVAAYNLVMEVAETLGLNVGEGSDFAGLVIGRAEAAAKDLLDNRGDGYDLATIRAAFDEIVATRLVFEESVALFAGATTEQPLANLDYITMLVTNLEAVEYQTIHSGRSINDDILPELNKLVEDFNALTPEQQETVLKDMNYSATTSSTATRNALRAAITQVLADEEAAIGAALDKVNTAEITDRVAAYNLVMEVAETLGLNVGEGSDFAGLVIGRAEAAAKDLLDNRGDGYDLATIRGAFDEIVATRLVFEESVAIFAAASETNPLTDLGYITMLIENLEAVEHQTIHSGKSIEEVILPELEGLVADFEALTPEQQETVLKDMNYSATTSSTATRNALRAAITQVLADEEAAIDAALDKVNTAEITDRVAAYNLVMEVAETLGLNVGEGSDFAGLVIGRAEAAAKDLLDNRGDGYDLATIRAAFDEIVATRLVFEESVAIFAAASETNPLTDLGYITMLIENLEAVEHQTIHSGKSIEEVILPELEGLVADFNALTPEQQETVLKDMNYSATTSSTATRNALRAAITQVLADEEAAIDAALDKVNTAEITDRVAAYNLVMEVAETLGLNVGEGSDFAGLVIGRAEAAAKDLLDNRGDGYDLATIRAAFDEIVATRLVFEESVALFAGATTEQPLANLDYITMLVTNLEAVEYQTIHSGRSINDDILPELNKLVEDFNALTPEQQETVLKDMNYSATTSSTATRNALRAAITQVLADEEAAIGAALDKVNTAEITDRVAAYNLVMEVAETLGLNVGEGSDFAGLVIGRAEAAAKDLLDNRGDGYDLATIRAAFDEIVATRLVFEESVAIFAAASETNPLTDLGYITMLIENLEAVEHQTIHSGKSIEEVILPELEGLVADFNALTPEQQETVLKDMNYSATTSSTATRNALRAAITQVLADEEAAIDAALDKVNTAEITDRVAAYNLVMEVAETLGLNVGEGSDFAGLVIGRAEAAAKDLLDNRGDGYDLATIRAAFDEIVATRLVFEESVAIFESSGVMSSGNWKLF
jgi:isochorismate hydrolase